MTFSWDVVTFESTYFQIQLDIENPEALTGNTQLLDQLSLTFWGTKYFTSTEGKEVRYGTNLMTDLYRQVNQITATVLDSFLFIAVISMIIVAASMFLSLISPIGTMTYTWIFINNLSLVVHLILLKSNVPPNVFYTFKTYLNILRPVYI